MQSYWQREEEAVGTIPALGWSLSIETLFNKFTGIVLTYFNNCKSAMLQGLALRPIFFIREREAFYGRFATAFLLRKKAFTLTYLLSFISGVEVI